MQEDSHRTHMNLQPVCNWTLLISFLLSVTQVGDKEMSARTGLRRDAQLTCASSRPEGPKCHVT